MKINNLFLFLMLTFLLACEGERIDFSIINRSIKVNARIDGMKTRATNDTWSEGDAIGIYMISAGEVLSAESVLAKNAKYVTEGGSAFNPSTVANDVKFPIDGSNVDFIAYYPHGSVGTDFGYSLNVTDQSNQAAIDVMYSNNVVAKNSSNPEIALQFTHKLSKLVFNFTPSVSGVDLSGLKAKLVDFNPRGKLSLIGGEVTSTSTKAEIQLIVSADGKTVEAIVLPTPDLTGKKLIIEHGLIGYEYEFSTAENISSFNSGYRYTFNITLDPIAITSVSATAIISPWSEGPSETVYLNKNFNVYQPVGAGTQENPYTIVDARNLSPLSGVWVKGYIVGYYTGTSVGTFSSDLSDPETVKETAFALAASSTETTGSNTFPVNLPIGTLRDALNLKKNPSNLGKEVKIKGNIGTYYGGIGMPSGVSDYEFISSEP
ncbi:MAG: fimbrillin family protein [Petrimonas sp.]|jgi:hypothetical protein